MTGLHAQQLHRQSIMANRRGAKLNCLATRDRPITSTGPGPAPSSRRPAATASPANTRAVRAASSGVVAESQLRGEHRGVGAARAVRRAAGVALALDAHWRLSAGREEQVARLAAVPAGEHDRARARARAPPELAPRPRPPAPPRWPPRAGEHARASGKFGVSTLARGQICSISARSASGSSSRAPDSATITGSTTTGVPPGSSSSACATACVDRDGAEHPDLDRVDADVCDHSANLRQHDLGINRQDRAYAARVLSRDRRDRAGAVYAAARERLQVGLDPGAPA